MRTLRLSNGQVVRQDTHERWLDQADPRKHRPKPKPAHRKRPNSRKKRRERNRCPKP